MTEHPTRALTSDVRIPLVGFGTYLIPNHVAGAAVREAIGLGYRHIDTAEAYQNEEGVGAGLRAALEAEQLTRDQVFITTKLWPGNAAWGQTPKTTEATIAALDASLARLGLDYVDLYLIHAPFDPAQRLAQWRGLVALREQRKARAIGVSNFHISHLEELAAAGLPPPAANQIELHPWSQKPALVRYLADHQICPIAYSSLAPLASWRTAPGHNSAKSEEMRRDGERPDSPFRQLAVKHRVSEAQILLRWAIQQGYPVLPKSTRPERMKQNADLFGFALDAADLAMLATLDRGDGVAWQAGDPTRAP